MPRLSFTQPADFLRERDFGQKIEASFDFVRAHFRPFGKCLLYIVLPAALLSGIGAGLMQSRMQAVKAAGPLRIEGMTARSIFESALLDLLNSPEVLLILLTSVASFILLILTTYCYLLLCLSPDKPSETIAVTDVWALVQRRFVGTLLATIGLGVVFVAAILPILGVFGLLQTMGSAVGLLLPVLYAVPFYLIITLSLFHIIWVREELGFFATLRRCFFLIRGKWWSTFGLLFVMSIIIGIMGIVVALPQTLLNASTLVTPDAAPANNLLLIATNGLSNIILTLLYPLEFLALAFQYFNLVERKEGEGLRTLVGRIGQPTVAAQPYAADRYRADDEGEY